MTDDTPRPAIQAAVDALQEATLVTGHLRRTRLADLDDLSQLTAALDRAIAALRGQGRPDASR